MSALTYSHCEQASERQSVKTPRPLRSDAQTPRATPSSDSTEMCQAYSFHLVSAHLWYSAAPAASRVSVSTWTLIVNSLNEFSHPSRRTKQDKKYRRNCNQLHMQGNLLDRPYSLYSSHSQSILATEEGRVTDGIISPTASSTKVASPGKALTRR